MSELRKIVLAGWRVDVNTGTEAVPVWTQVKGIRSPALAIDSTKQDTSTYDSNGWGSDGTTQKKWKLTIEGLEGYTGEFVRDPGQVTLKAKGRLLGADSEVEVRFYRADPDEGYTGTAEADWKGTGGPVTDYTPFNIDLTGQGELLDYTPAP